MIRRFASRLGTAAVLCVLAALLLWAAPGVAVPAARAEETPALLRVEVSARPEGLIAPGDVTLSFTLENTSDAVARGIYLSSADGLISELVGQIEPGEMQTFTRQHSVTAQELDAGEILYTVSCDDPSDANVKISYPAVARIHRGDALPGVEFTRQFSTRSVEAGGTVTITYRIRNTGNVTLTDLRVQDALGDYTGRVDALATGESRTLINRAVIGEASVSSASLSYCAEGSDEDLSETLSDVAVNIAEASLRSSFTAGYSAFSRSTADVVLVLTNTGGADYRELCVIDDLYGGVIADDLILPAGGEPLEISHAYALRGDAGFRWRVTGAADTGEQIDFLTDTVTLPPREAGSAGALTLSVRALTPQIRRAGSVTLRVNIDNLGGVDVRDLTLCEETLGELHTFAVLPADGAIQRDFSVYVSGDAVYNFIIRGADADGNEIAAAAAAVEVAITPDGALPEGAQERFIEFSGGSIKIGGSSAFAVLLIAACAVLLTLIIILIIATRRARLERQLRIAAERQRRREELGKTNRFTPVRAPQNSKSKGRNG